MRFHHFQIDPAKYSSVLTKSEPGISHGGQNSTHFDAFCTFYCFFYIFCHFGKKNIAHLESHHLAEHNEAGHTPLDPPRRVSMKDFSLSRFWNRRNSFLKKMFGKPAPEGVIRVGDGAISREKGKALATKGKRESGKPRNLTWI